MSEVSNLFSKLVFAHDMNTFHFLPYTPVIIETHESHILISAVADIHLQDPTGLIQHSMMMKWVRMAMWNTKGNLFVMVCGNCEREIWH